MRSQRAVKPDGICAVDGHDECLVAGVVARDVAGEEGIGSWDTGCRENTGYDGMPACSGVEVEFQAGIE